MARVPYLSADELDPAYREYAVSTLQYGKPLNLYAAVANNPPVLAGLRSFLGALWSESGLSDRRRELVILSVAAERRSAYEWQQHVSIALDAGATEAEVTAIAAGDDDPFPEDEAALLSYVRAVATESVTDEVHEAVATHFDVDAVVGAAALATCYVQVALVIEALGIEIEAGDEFAGWSLD